MTRVVPITNAAAERRAAIMGLPEMVPTSEPMAEPVASVTLAVPVKLKVLGPGQLAWLRAQVPSFETCEKQALDAEAHRLATLAAVRA